MIFSLFGEIGLVLIGFLYVSNKWFDSFVDLLDIIKNNEETKELPESLKHIYS